jgi:uncharacterized protein with PQ loop repeat
VTFYQLAGTLNTVFVLVAVSGIWFQVRKIWELKRSHEKPPTEILSLNQFATGFLAYWAFFVYGYSIRPFNHFLAWPRLVACLLTLLILLEIWRDRRTRASLAVLSTAIALMLLGLAGLGLGASFSDEGRVVSQTLIVAAAVLLGQGYLHQIAMIWRSGKTGAISLRMNQFILAMDVTGILFAFSLGIAVGWPLLLLSLVSGITKLAIMWLFRWTRFSPMAMQRRAAEIS